MARLKPKNPYSKKHVFDAIINEWIRAAAVGGGGVGSVDASNIKLVLDEVLDLSDAQDTRTISVIVDTNNGGNRVHYLSVPLPEPGAQTVTDWINGKYPQLTDQEGLAAAVLYGCGR